MNFTNPEEFHDPIDEDERAKGNGDWRKIAMGKDGFFKRAIKTTRKTFAGENLAGKIGSVAKNIIKPFVPFGSTIDSVTDKIGDSLKTEKPMANESIFQKIIRFLKQPSTKDGIAVLVLIIGAIFSIDIDPEVLTSSLLGIVTGIAGAWVGVKSLIGIFKDEDA